MAKKQTRRSISFSRADYEAAQEAAKRLDIPLAQLAAEALHEYLDRRSAQPRAIGADEPHEPVPLGRRGHASWCMSLKRRLNTGACDCDGDSEDEIIEQDLARAAASAPGELRANDGAAVGTFKGAKLPAEVVFQDLRTDHLQVTMLRDPPLNWSDISGQPSAEQEPAGADTKVVYDEDVQAKRAAAAARRKR